MSRRRRRCPAPWIVAVILGVAAVALAAALWRIYPEYRRLRAKEAASPQIAPEPETQQVPKPVVVRLYFARVVEGRQRMVAISRELPSGLGTARAALEELLRGEVPRGCDRPLPQGTTVRRITVAEGAATVDFSRQLVEGFRGGSDNEGVLVYSIVNTLTSLPTIDKVQLLVEGEKVSQIGGHLLVSEPLGFDEELVVPYP